MDKISNESLGLANTKCSGAERRELSLGKITGNDMKFGMADSRGGGDTGRNGMRETAGD